MRDDLIADLNVLTENDSWQPDERVVILTESLAHAALDSGELPELVQKALAAMSLSGQRVCVLSVQEVDV